MLNLFIWFFKALNQFLYHPKQVFYFCLGVIFVSLILQGTLLQLVRLNADEAELDLRIAQLEKDNENLAYKIKKVSNPKYLEMEVRERLDWVESGDLVFLFTDSHKGD